ncbi:efflux RND transporter permease subunit [Leadbettera azotonutricia]|uniref:Putative acriflavin resistance protein n=1 Tax=Leadbettera azotonutricia (strain ATCC BAA-888 / DSM 13862 / ZAS-9) TaxID=545695 RepID=F5YAE7_LEAAZ|nr:efflux RND transporter permease subunit [Leadbettera azotonutricia]AEF80351.1 putative acriflavin resistance protein [Leadbettera azotonutricia ZAS-9]
MDISEISVRKPVTVTMLYILVCVIAAVFIPRLGIALYPSVSPPYVNVMTSYSNVGPEEIDKTVTKPIFNSLRRIADVKSITSNSSSGRSRVQLEFGYSKDMDEAVADVTAALARITNSLPDGCGAPTIMRFSMSAMPIMRMAVMGDMSLDELRVISEETVQPLLERVSGVASAEINGGVNREIHVDVNNNRLEAYGLTLQSITSALAARNVQVSNGTLTHGITDYEIITDEYFKSLDDIRNTVISAGTRLDDVAEVYEATDNTGRRVYINGEPGIYISITNESGTNPSTISKGVHAILPEIADNLPKGVSVSVLSDDTSLIDSTMNEVYSSGIQGAVLAMLIIFLFLRNFRSSIIIGMSIPISIVITLMVMAVMDLTINMMTMSGLILGMGMTVDSSIVILENINKRRSWGEKSAVAAIFGSRNMVLAIIASTATTVCVFVPVLLYRAELEMYGMMFQELILTVVVSLIVSLIVSVTLVPALAGSIIKIYTRTQKPLRFKPFIILDDIFAKLIKGLEDGYAASLRFCLKNRLIVLVMVFAILILSMQRLTSTGMNLTPSSQSDDQVNINISLPVGTTAGLVQQYLFDFQEIIVREFPRDAYNTIVINTGGSNSGSVQINLPKLKDQKISAREIQSKLTPFTTLWSDVRITFSSGRGPGGGSGGVNIKVISDDTESMTLVSNEIVALLKANVPRALNPASALDSGSPRYEVRIDTDAASAAGVNVNTISALLKTAITGSTATTYHIGGDDVSIIVSLAESDLAAPADLGAITIQTANGLMALDNFITYQEGISPQQIQREEGVRVNRVTASLAPGAIATEVQAQVEKLVNENIVLPETVKLEYQGDARDIRRFGGAFLVVILLAAFLVFCVMAAQFESLVDPFIIFASIPLLAIGVMAVYQLTGQTISLYSLVGIVALVGIVVNNGIVLVDFTNQLVERKTPVFEACVEAGRNRLQPILMTTLTTVLGMVPIAFFPGEGAESMQPICMTIVGGLLSGAFMTLFVSPILYSLFNKRREKRFNDPESLMNQLEEVDEIKAKNIKVELVRKDT